MTKEEIFLCNTCGEKLDVDSGCYCDVDNNYYCQNCFDDKFFYCEDCGKAQLSYMGYWFGDCHYCQNCFSERAFICDSCGEATSFDEETYINGDRECIACSEENRTPFEEIELERIKTKSETFNKNKFKNFCGVEIETYNHDLEEKFFCRNDLEKYGFSQMEDGSLDSCGVEFVSNIFNGDLLLKKVKKFCDKLHKRNYYINSSCGLHIHIKIPKTMTYLKKVYSFYKKFEDYFFLMLPQSRQHNTYCRTIALAFGVDEQEFLNFKKCNEFEKKFYKTKNQNHLKHLKKNKYNEKRYCWINFHSVFYRGTLEIRNHSGTINPQKINNWFLIHLTALDFIKNLNIETINQLPQTKEFFLSLFNSKIQTYIKNRWNKFKEFEQEENN